MLQTSRFRIDGLTPLLMNRYMGQQSPKSFELLSPEERLAWARGAAYLTPEGTPYIPNGNFQQCLIAAGGYLKGKGRRNLSRTVAAGVQVAEAELSITSAAPTLFSAMRKNPATGGRMLGYRLMIGVPWTATVSVHWDDELLQSEQVVELLRNAGIRIGIMDWRPEKRGPYGQFRATLL